jgi:Acyl-CoA carboxylase epsilon subunit
VTGPLFHVKRGDPTPEELAALTAVLAAKARAAAAARSRRHAGPPPWGDPATAHRRPLPAPGPGAWKRGLWTAAGTPFRGSATLPVGAPSTGWWGFRVPGNGGAGRGGADAGRGGADA